MKEYYLDIVRYWVEKLVEDKNSYNINAKEVDKNIIIDVEINKENIGKVIGKNGKIITSIRNLVNSISNKDKLDITIKVNEKN